MKKYTVVGIQTNSGVIKANNKPWTNYTLFCVVNEDREIKNVVGGTVDTIKVSERVMKEFANNYGSTITGRTVAINFDRQVWQGVEKVVVSEIYPLDESED